jgi:transcriptional regulator with XRE-family HTH domain
MDGSDGSAATNGYGARIRRARLNANLTRAQLAELTGVSPRSIGNYERGTSVPPDHVAIAIAKVTRTTASTLLFGTDS